jgi:YidC/Oxa1 family membrane protein insertase
MDRNSTIGFILIAILITVWMFYMSSQQTPPPGPTAQTKTEQEKAVEQPAPVKTAVPVLADSSADQGFFKYGKWFNHLTGADEQTISIKTTKYSAEFTTKGGGIKHWTLSGFSTWNGKPLQLIDWNIPSDHHLLFLTSDGKLIETGNLDFRFKSMPSSTTISLKDSERFSLSFVLPVRGDSAVIVKTYTLIGGSYAVDMDVELKNMAGVIANNEYEVTLHSPALTEKNSVEEASFAETSAFIDGSITKLDVSSIGKRDSIQVAGNTHWVAAHNKYFLNALISKGGEEGSGAFLRGEHIPLPNGGSRELYQASLKLKYLAVPYEKSSFTVFIAPLNYDLLKSQHEGLEQVLSLGWAWIVRPISEYLFIPLFTFLHSFIPNYGIVIIIFTILIKLVLYPLTKSSMQSMRKMQALQPLMNEIREKNKEDQQKQNTEMMRLYKDYGINPAGGCLPLVLQMPILFALFSIFRSTIELRQQPFVWWIKDLATADVIFTLPFTIPLLGVSFISGLALLMAVTMFIQQKQSVQDPRQKAMVYVMPVMFWIMFNAFPSGLNLYYFLFNLLSIIQQYYMNKKHAGDVLQKVPQKKSKGKGWMERTLSSLEEKAKHQKKLGKK